PVRAEEFEWMKWYKRLGAPLRAAGKVYYFDMEGSRHWGVLHFRTESDEASTSRLPCGTSAENLIYLLSSESLPSGQDPVQPRDKQRERHDSNRDYFQG